METVRWFRLQQCEAGLHMDWKSFSCQGTNCEMGPTVCTQCGFKSKKWLPDTVYLCRLCRIQEAMEEEGDLDEDCTAKPELSLVYSASQNAATVELDQRQTLEVTREGATELKKSIERRSELLKEAPAVV